jgi:hypothetical protein
MARVGPEKKNGKVLVGLAILVASQNAVFLPVVHPYLGRSMPGGKDARTPEKPKQKKEVLYRQDAHIMPNMLRHKIT